MRKAHGLFLAALLAASVLSAGPTKQAPFGLGLAVPFRITPAPSAGLGITGKYWMHSVNALDFDVFGGSGWVSVDADYLWHRYGIFSGSGAKRMPVYFGPGANLTLWSSGGYSGSVLGVQGKVGVSYLFTEPLDLYLELVPSLIFVGGVQFSIGSALGGRFYF